MNEVVRIKKGANMIVLALLTSNLMAYVMNELNTHFQLILLLKCYKLEIFTFIVFFFSFY